MTPEQFVDEFGRARVSAILRTDDQRKAAEALGRVGGKSAVPALLAAAGDVRTGFSEAADAVRIHDLAQAAGMPFSIKCTRS